MDIHFVPVLDFHHHIKSRGRFPFQDAFLRAAETGLLVAQGYGLDAAYQVGQGRVHNQVIQGVAVGGSNELDATLGDGAGGGGFLGSAHFVDNDDLGHMVFHGLNHHGVLFGGGRHLHPAGVANGGMGDVAIAGNFVGSINDDDAFAGFVGQRPGYFAQHSGLADAGAAQQQDVPAAVGQVFNHFDSAKYGAAHPAGDADDAAAAVADGGDAMQGALHSRPVVAAEIANPRHYILKVGAADRLVIQ